MSQLPILMAQEKKLFQAEGLDAEVLQIQTALAMPAIVSGELDYTTSAETTIRAAVSGLPVKAIGFIGIRSSLVLVSQPGITSVQALRGGRIAVSSLRTTTDFVARDILRHHGLNPDTDIVSLPLGSEANKIAALKGGAVDAAILTLPDDSIAAEQGFRKLVAEDSYDLMVKTFSPDGAAPEKLIRDLIDEVRRAQSIDREVSVSDVTDFSFVRAAAPRKRASPPRRLPSLD